MTAGSSAREARTFFQLQRAAHLLKKRADKALIKRVGITAAQAAVMAIVAGEQRMSQRHVADQLGQNESAMTAMVRRLVALGYLERKRAADDARKWDLALTEPGKSAMADASAAFGTINAAIEQALEPGEVQTLASILGKLLDMNGK